jgi:aminoglycoside 6'-N-acetyltransferase I
MLGILPEFSRNCSYRQELITRIMQIIDLYTDNKIAIQQAAMLLLEGFREHWSSAWSDLESAWEEVQESLGTDRISRIAVDEAGTVLGWIGGIKQYDGNVWELHPLVVGSDYRGKGIGKALVADLEEQVSTRGGLTLWVGTDDEDNMTTLAGVNLYPNVFEHIAKIKNLRGHPYEFYQKCGFVIVGLMPDANGLGKPDIYMAKSLKGES